MAYRNQQDGNYLPGVQCPNCGHFAAKYGGCLTGLAGQLVALVAIVMAIAGLISFKNSAGEGIALWIGAVLVFVLARRVAGVGGYGCTNCGYHWKSGAVRTSAVVSAPPSTPPATTPVAPAGSVSTADELERIAALHSSGALTDQEYAAAKARLLGGGAQRP